MSKFKSALPMKEKAQFPKNFGLAVSEKMKQDLEDLKATGVAVPTLVRKWIGDGLATLLAEPVSKTPTDQGKKPEK